MVPSSLLLLASTLLATSAAASGSQKVLTPPSRHQHDHRVDADVLAALEKHKDPVDAYISLFPDSAAKLAEPRLLHIAGEDKARWLTEGDKMRLRRIPAKFADVTDHYQFYDHLMEINAKPEPR